MPPLHPCSHGLLDLPKWTLKTLNGAMLGREVRRVKHLRRIERSSSPIPSRNLWPKTLEVGFGMRQAFDPFYARISSRVQTAPNSSHRTSAPRFRRGNCLVRPLHVALADQVQGKSTDCPLRCSSPSVSFHRGEDKTRRRRRELGGAAKRVGVLDTIAFSMGLEDG